MRRIWLLLGVGLVAGAISLGAMACSDDDDGGDGDSPTATAEMLDETPIADETPAGDETPVDGEPSGFSTLVVTDGVLTTFDGYTVYTFDNDESGVSNCDATCAGTWPPLPVAGEATGGEGVTGTVSTITRDDGSTQVTYDDQPLYLFSGDATPGETNGDGVGGIWHVVTIN